MKLLYIFLAMLFMGLNGMLLANYQETQEIPEFNITSDELRLEEQEEPLEVHEEMGKQVEVPSEKVAQMGITTETEVEKAYHGSKGQLDMKTRKDIGLNTVE